MARLSKSHNQLALATSIEEGMKAQSQQRKLAKPHTNKHGATEATPADGNGTSAVDGGPNVPGNAPGLNTQQGVTAPVAGGTPSEPTATNTGGATSHPSTATVPPAPNASNGLGAGVAGTGHSSQQLLAPKSVAGRSDSTAGENSSNTSGKFMQNSE